MRSFSALPTALLVLLSHAFTTAAETFDDGLQIDLLSGPVTCDRPTRSHDRVAVHYIGTLQSDGSEFDQSYKRGRPFIFGLDEGHVIKGWDEGIQGMCIGQTRRLTIPPELGYGDRGAPPAIPPGSTLVFETKLMDIVQLSPDPEPTTTQEQALTIATAPPTTLGDGGVHDDEELKESFDNTAVVPQDGAPTDHPENQTRCNLVGPFALLVQGALGALALLTLVWKRWREVPKRPWKIFFFDVSKQVFGSMLTHVINLAMSELGSVDMANAAAHVTSTGGATDKQGRSPNPCSFYLLNLGIDTTIGVPVLWFLLKVLYRIFLLTPLANPPESIKSGHYGQPPHAAWYLKQLFIYCVGLVGMKLFVFFLFLAMPWLPWIGDWALRWTEGNEALQITFALFLFPLAMNAVQYWVIDNFIMDKKQDGDSDDDGKGYQQVAGDDEFDEERAGSSDDATVVEEHDVVVPGKSQRQNHDARTLKEVDPLPVPAANPRSGEGSRRSDDDDLKNK